MVSRRKFTVGIGLVTLNLLLGCDNKVTPIVAAVPDVFALFWSNPVVKLLNFLKIINTTLTDIYSSNLTSHSVTIKFATSNPGVNGEFNLPLHDKSEFYVNEYCDFMIPTNEVVHFSPAQFIKVNNLAEGDESGLRYLDSKLFADYAECNQEVLDNPDGNQMTMLKLRAECFERKGYCKVQHDYNKIKIQSYEI